MVRCLLFLVATWAWAAEYYISPSGNSSNTGAIGSPWTLTCAAANTCNTSISPGDTIWGRGGTYTDTPLNINLVGTQSAPYTFRAYPGEVPIVDVMAMNPTPPNPPQYAGELGTSSQWVRVIGFVFTNRNTARGEGTDNVVDHSGGFANRGRNNYVSRLKILNGGFGLDAFVQNNCGGGGSRYMFNLVAYIGQLSSLTGLNHGSYSQSCQAGRQYWFANTLVQPASIGMSIYGSATAPLKRITMIGHAIIKPGEWQPSSGPAWTDYAEQGFNSLTLGGNGGFNDIVIERSSIYQDHTLSRRANIMALASGGGARFVMRDNVFMSWRHVMETIPTGVTSENNTFIGTIHNHATTINKTVVYTVDGSQVKALVDLGVSYDPEDNALGFPCDVSGYTDDHIPINGTRFCIPKGRFHSQRTITSSSDQGGGITRFNHSGQGSEFLVGGYLTLESLTGGSWAGANNGRYVITAVSNVTNGYVEVELDSSALGTLTGGTMRDLAVINIMESDGTTPVQCVGCGPQTGNPIIQSTVLPKATDTVLANPPSSGQVINYFTDPDEHGIAGVHIWNHDSAVETANLSYAQMGFRPGMRVGCYDQQNWTAGYLATGVASLAGSLTIDLPNENSGIGEFLNDGDPAPEVGAAPLTPVHSSNRFNAIICEQRQDEYQQVDLNVQTPAGASSVTVISAFDGPDNRKYRDLPRTTVSCTGGQPCAIPVRFPAGRVRVKLVWNVGRPSGWMEVAAQSE